jgi:hypothetical protein
MSNFFDIFASCCGERNPKKIKTKARSESREKVDEDKDKDPKAPLLESPRARIPDFDIKDFLNKCSGEFRSTLSPIPSVGSHTELSSKLSQSELFFLSSSGSPSSNGDATPPTTPRLTPAQPPRSPSPFPTPRNSLREALQIIGDLISLSTPPNSPNNSPREIKERSR